MKMSSFSCVIDADTVAALVRWDGKRKLRCSGMKKCAESLGEGRKKGNGELVFNG